MTQWENVSVDYSSRIKLALISAALTNVVIRTLMCLTDFSFLASKFSFVL